MNTPTQTDKAREAFAGFLRTPVIERRMTDAERMRNLLNRREAIQRDRRFTGRPLTGFGELA